MLLLFSGSLIAAGGPTSGHPLSAPSAGGASTTIDDENVDNVFNLSDFGAVGDGNTDNGPALQAALNAIAAAGGGTLFVPAGRYAINTPVQKDFTGSAASLTILGVESLTPVPPPNSGGQVLTHGLDLSSEFAPRTGTQGIAISITGLETFLIKDITFIGTLGVNTDASITLALSDIWDATIRHCEFYGLSSLVGGGAIVQSVRSHLHLEQSVFLGSACNGGAQGAVVQNFEWKSVTVANTIFADYGQRAELFGKIGLGTPASWVNIGNAAIPTNKSPRREAVIKDVFLDEGALNGLSTLTYGHLPSAPIDLMNVSGLHMNVSNLHTSGNYLDRPRRVLIENSHYGWSHDADTAINLVGVGNAILDQVECSDDANRIRADENTGKLTVINSVYEHLDSQSPQTRVITTETPDEDPVQHVRQQFISILGREPDAAAHFYWSDRLLQCGDDEQCINAERTALETYLSTAPAPSFAIAGTLRGESGAGLAGVTVTLSDSQSVSTQTGSDGRYSFDRLPTSGVYTVTPDRSIYTFGAYSRTFTTPSNNQTADFTAVDTVTISGLVTKGTTPLSDVIIILGGSHSDITGTDAAGFYSIRVPVEGSYTITPAKQYYLFSPVSASFDNVTANQTADFNSTQMSLLAFDASSYNISEGARRINVTVSRNGDTSSAAELVYSATDGSADQRSDVIPIVGRLNFAPGQTSELFTILITDDAHVEGDESLMLELRGVVGAALGENNTAMLTILDNDTVEPEGNPIDGARFFVRQQYRDFLNRTADPAGLAFWSDQILSCGSDAACIADRRINVSAAFFLSIEFQETGFLVYRLYKASYGQPPQHINEFLLDTRTIGQGVVVNAPGWQELLEANKVALIQDFVGRGEFVLRYPLELTPVEFVNELNANAGDVLSPSDAAAAVAEFGGTGTSEENGARARVLRRVAENQSFSQREMNPAFVLQQYFGYLQRNPNEDPDTNLDGYNFWLQKLNEFNGDFRRAEMVKSFLVSTEYRERFGAH